MDQQSERLTDLERELVDAVEGMFEANEEICAEFMHHKRAANWGLINEKWMAAECVLAKVGALQVRQKKARR